MRIYNFKHPSHALTSAVRPHQLPDQARSWVRGTSQIQGWRGLECTGDQIHDWVFLSTPVLHPRPPLVSCATAWTCAPMILNTLCTHWQVPCVHIIYQTKLEAESEARRKSKAREDLSVQETKFMTGYSSQPPCFLSALFLHLSHWLTFSTTSTSATWLVFAKSKQRDFQRISSSWCSTQTSSKQHSGPQVQQIHAFTHHCPTRVLSWCIMWYTPSCGINRRHGNSKAQCVCITNCGGQNARADDQAQRTCIWPWQPHVAIGAHGQNLHAIRMDFVSGGQPGNPVTQSVGTSECARLFKCVHTFIKSFEQHTACESWPRTLTLHLVPEEGGQGVSLPHLLHAQPNRSWENKYWKKWRCWKTKLSSMLCWINAATHRTHTRSLFDAFTILPLCFLLCGPVAKIYTITCICW